MTGRIMNSYDEFVCDEFVYVECVYVQFANDEINDELSNVIIYQ